jgi:DnaJ-class molecular chaperone
MGPVRGRLSMTNFYEHLGVKNSATLEEIEDAFEK